MGSSTEAAAEIPVGNISLLLRGIVGDRDRTADRTERKHREIPDAPGEEDAEKELKLLRKINKKVKSQYMMDQFGNGYKDQYKKETLQIHAPAGLLERTRQAVAEEERRLQAEHALDEQDRTERAKQQDPTAEVTDTDAGWQNTERTKDNHRKYHRVFGWAVSAAAAAILLLAVHESAMLREGGAGEASMDSGSDMAAAGGYAEGGSMNGFAEGTAKEPEEEMAINAAKAEPGEESDGAESAAAAAEDYAKLQKSPAETDYAKAQKFPAKTENSTSVSGEAAESTGGERSSKAAESSVLNRDADEGIADTDNNDSAERCDRGNQIKESEKKYSAEDSASWISITEVDKKPDFCDRADTKRIVRQGINFYVTESTVTEETADKTEPDLDGWSAYAEYNRTKYIITGQANDRDEFLEKAYEILIETVEGY